VKIVLHRSGGIANIPLHREVDTHALADGAAVEALAHAAMKVAPPDRPLPDAYMYELSIDGRRFVVMHPDGAWAALIASLERS
jgi:hypothetical protein